jgi:hypothetical protein
LHAHRSATDVTASSLSRQCDGWWGPDDLLEVERGAWPLDDAGVVSICHLYGLAGRGLPASDALELVIDRTDSSELVDDGAGLSRATGELGLIRLEALRRILGGVAVASDASLEVLSVAFDMSTDEVRSALAHADGPGRDAVSEVAAALVDRVVVPTAGLLVATTPSGSVMLARRAGAPWGTWPERAAAAGPLRWFAAVSAASA